jgi:hypothetical protein
MKLIYFHRKPVSMLVMIAFTFLLFFCASQAPAAPSAPAAGTKSAATLERGENDGPNVFEQEGEGGSAGKKAKKFPWLIAGLGAVAIGVVVYFLVIKKPKYTLSVTLGAGCSGNPASTSSFKKGKVVSYSYAPLAGFSGLQVKLDGALVPASGAVTMNANHALEVSASQQHTLTVSLGAGTCGTPAATASYDRDQVVHYIYAALPGYADLKVKLDGVLVPYSGTVTMNADHALEVSASKQYTLTVTLGQGVIGTPAATASYNQGQIVNYSYGMFFRISSAFFIALKVRLDGVLVPHSGTVTMNGDHTLTAFVWFPTR